MDRSRFKGISGLVIFSALLSFSTHAADLVGNLPGSFEVSQGGQATYRLPLELPVGHAGMSPSLTLQYSSGAGNGLLGWGWDMGGFPAITRCNGSVAQHGNAREIDYTSADRYCLEGSLLVEVASGEYRTEIDSFSRIRKYSTYWTVEYPNGNTATFGNTTDSRMTNANGTFSWALNTLEDPNGNAIHYVYETDAGGALRPLSIDYTSTATGAAYYSVDFSYEAVPAAAQGDAWYAGQALARHSRMTSVQVNYSGTQVRKYEFNYAVAANTSRSQLVDITLCGTSSSECLPPTTITYENALAGSIPSGSWLFNEDAAPIAIDLNFDGFQDVLYQDDVQNNPVTGLPLPNSGRAFVRLSNGSTLGSDLDTNVGWLFSYATPFNNDHNTATEFLVPGATVFQVYSFNGTTFTSVNTAVPKPDFSGKGTYAVLDLNADGFQDIVVGNPLATHMKIYYGTGTPGTFSAEKTYSTGGVIAESGGLLDSRDDGRFKQTRTADFDGDGRADLLMRLQDEIPCGPNTCTINYWAILYSRVTDTTSAPVFDIVVPGGSPIGYEPLGVDINQDGLTDLVYITSGTIRYRYSNGLGFEPEVNTGLTIAAPENVAAIALQCQVDGRTVVQFTPASPAIHLKYNGTDFISYTPATNECVHASNPDVNGDGAADYMNHLQSHASGGNPVQVALAAGLQTDRVKTIRDSFDALVADITYSRLSDASVYTKGSGGNVTSAPEISPRSVVKSYQASNGIGGNYTVNYEYEDLRNHYQGRGGLGFAKRTVTDSRLPVEVITTFRQDFPYVGYELTKQTNNTSTGHVVNQTTNAPQTLTIKSTSVPDIVWPYVETSVFNEYELDESLIRSTRTQYTFTVEPLSGVNYLKSKTKTLRVSAVDQTASADLAAAKQVLTHELINYLTDWCIGVEVEITDERTPSTGAVLARSNTQAWTPSKCRINSSRQNAHSAKYVDTSYGYDTFGNITSITVDGADTPPATTTFSYSVDGRFKTGETNAEGLTVGFTHNATTGTLTTRTEPNGTQVSYLYDTLGRVRRETHPNGTWITTAREFCSSCVATQAVYRVKTETFAASGSIAGEVTITEYDASGRALLTATPTLTASEYSSEIGSGWSLVEVVYDSQARELKRSNPYFYNATKYWTEFDYDLLNRVTLETRPDLSTQSYSYSVSGGIRTEVTDPLSHTKILIKDVLGRVTSVTEGGNVTDYAYDAFGNLTSSSAPDVGIIDSTITVGYDDRGYKQSLVDPDMGSWTYVHNSLGQLISQTDAAINETTLEYDLAGRLVRRSEDEGSSEWHYDHDPAGSVPIAPYKGRVHSIIQKDDQDTVIYQERFWYGSFGEVTRKRTTIGPLGSDIDYDIDYAYDDFGRVAQVIYPDSIAPYNNANPTASAMASDAILPNNISLIGSNSSDDGFPAALTYAWSQTAGPSSLSISNSGSADTTATTSGALPGHYTFSLFVDDSVLTDTDTVTIALKPSAPASITVPSQSTTGSYTVSWTAPTYGATGSTSYQLQERLLPSGSWSTVYTGTTLSKAISGKTDGQSFEYRVTACQGVICGPYKTSTAITMVLPPAAPATPTNSEPTSNDGSYIISWVKPAGTVTSYTLEEDSGTSFSGAVTGSWSQTALSKSFSKSSNGNWVYRVKACNGTVCSGWSGVRGATVSMPPPPAPAPMSITNFDVDTGDFKVNWSSSGAGVTSYQLQQRIRQSSNGAVLQNWTTVYTGTALYYNDSGTGGKTYDYQARACKGSLCGSYASMVSVVVPNTSCPPFCGFTGESSETETLQQESTPESTPETGGETSTDTATPETGSETTSLSPSPFQGEGRGEGVIPVAATSGPQTDNGFRLMPPQNPSEWQRSLARPTHAPTPTERRLARALKTDFGGDMSGYRFSVSYSYTRFGHLKQVADTANPTLVYWQASATDAAGQITQQQAGNGLVTTRTYDPYTQRLKTIQTGSGASIQDLSYDWDANGNLTERQDHNQNLVEIFTYDDLNRLQGSTLNSLTNLALTYDAAGNIKTKSGVGDYNYDCGCTDPRPHAVQSIALYAGGSITFSYDANGNLQSGDGKTTQWTSYRYPKQISNSANNSVTSFAYGPDRQRYSETILRNGLTAEQRHIIGSLYERETKGGIITHKHHILAGNQVIAIHDRRDDHSTDTRYLHRDHLGSVDTITGDTGGVITRMSFDAFGQRRDATDWEGEESSSNVADQRDITTRGYTGHQMLDDAGYIHMGGRVYDPTLGRFLSPDPNIPDPANSQAFNRYAYVYNNPLSYTDPSGFLPTRQMQHPGIAWPTRSPMAPSASEAGVRWCHDGDTACQKKLEAKKKGRSEVTKEVDKKAADAVKQAQTGDASGETDEKQKDNSDTNGNTSSDSSADGTQSDAAASPAEQLLQDNKFVHELNMALSDAADAAQRQSDPSAIGHDPGTPNATMGVAIKADEDSATGYTYSIPTTRVVEGVELTWGGLAQRRIKDPVALVLSPASHVQIDAVLKSQSAYNYLSSGFNGVPVFVMPSGRDRGTVYVFQSGHDPIQVK